MIRSYPWLIVSKSLIGSKLHPPPFPTTQAYHHISSSSATKCLIHPVPGQSKSFAKMAANSRVQEVKEMYLNMDLESKRKQYACKEKFVDLAEVSTWAEYYKTKGFQPYSDESDEIASVDVEISNKVSLWQGDITALEIDAIVNAANNKCLGGGGVDGAIHRAAGEDLYEECLTLNGCPDGIAKITGGYKLPSKYIIHTVGPRNREQEVLENCYINSLKLMVENGLKSIAFPCIATGIYGYPNAAAAEVALKNVRKFLTKNKDKVDRVIFTVFLKEDLRVYEDLMRKYFPMD